MLLKDIFEKVSFENKSEDDEITRTQYRSEEIIMNNYPAFKWLMFNLAQFLFQDGGSDGTITKVVGFAPGWTQVTWDTGYTNDYRNGAQGKIDLEKL